MSKATPKFFGTSSSSSSSPKPYFGDEKEKQEEVINKIKELFDNSEFYKGKELFEKEVHDFRSVNDITSFCYKYRDLLTQYEKKLLAPSTQALSGFVDNLHLQQDLAIKAISSYRLE
jgi:PAB1-binding protein PBP1